MDVFTIPGNAVRDVRGGFDLLGRALPTFQDVTDGSLTQPGIRRFRSVGNYPKGCDLGDIQTMNPAR